LQVLADPLPGHGIELAERLVQEHGLGLVDQGLAKGGALLHAAGELGRQPVLEVLQMDLAQELLDPVLVSLNREPAQLELDLDIVAHASPGKEGVVLGHDADIGLLALDLAAVDQDGTAALLQESGHHQHQGRLTATTWPEQRDELAGADLEIGRAESMHRLPALAEGFRHPLKLDCSAHVSSAGSGQSGVRAPCPGPLQDGDPPPAGPIAPPGDPEARGHPPAPLTPGGIRCWPVPRRTRCRLPGVNQNALCRPGLDGPCDPGNPCRPSFWAGGRIPRVAWT
jgi:hypothetical protein